MINMAEKNRIKRSNKPRDRRLYLIAELQKLGMIETDDGRKLEECTLFTLEHVHINEKSRIGSVI